MNKVASSFSLSAYDFLAVLIPGGIILSSIIYGFLKDCSIEPNTPEWFYYTLLFIIAYLLGLIWKMFMEWTFTFHRNNIKAIQNSYVRFFKTQNKEEVKTSKYLSAYYFLQRENGLGAIPILEKQVAFIRNILLLPPLFVTIMERIFNCEQLATCLKDAPNKSFPILFCCFIVSCILYYWLIKTQEKIYDLIWEGYHYYSQFSTIDTDLKGCIETKEKGKDLCSGTKMIAVMLLVEIIFVCQCCICSIICIVTIFLIMILEKCLIKLFSEEE